jgi:hypothetical protein
MTDIVERLEERASRMAELGSDRGDLLLEARDEIVRLRAKRDEQARLKWEAYDANKALTAERDRLRDALEATQTSAHWWAAANTRVTAAGTAGTEDAALKGDTP